MRLNFYIHAMLALLALVVPGRALSQVSPFVPNDPYFFTNTPAGFPGQWHLDKQTTGMPFDVNIRGAWERGLTGAGVTIAFAEKQLDWEHPDIYPNYAPEHSWDFRANAPLLSGLGAGREHATAVAGMAAARGGNGIGVTGAAPYARIASLAINDISEPVSGPISVYDPQSDTYLADSLLHHNAIGDSGIHIKSYSYHPTNAIGFTSYSLAEQAIVDATAQGVIVVSHAGNYRAWHGIYVAAVSGVEAQYLPPVDANITKSTLRRLPEVINVAALNTSGTFANYSNFGSNMTVTVPVGDQWFVSNGGVLSTDTRDTFGYGGADVSGPGGTTNPFPDIDYATGLTGTSFAAPLLSGVLALAKEAQPNLDTRFAKHLLARTSIMVDAPDATAMGGWTTNSAGIHFNNNYGFGLVDADALTSMATEFIGVTTLEEISTSTIAVNANVPLNNNDGVTRTFVMTEDIPLEEVVVDLRIGHGGPGHYNDYFDRGDIEAWITSPSGVTSLLLYRNPLDTGRRITSTGSIDWPFLTNAFWGESIAGEWAVTVRDTDATRYDDVGTYWHDFEVTFRSGSLIAAEPGDFNADGLVDMGDYDRWAQDYGSTVRLSADDNGDGVVNAADYTIWRDSIAEQVSLRAPAVPEPSALLPAAAAICGSRMRRRSL